MPESPPLPRALCWIAPDQVDVVRAVGNACGVSIAYAGSAEKGRSGGVADSLGADPVDDLRSALASADVDLILITEPGAFGSGGANDTSAVEAARSRGVRIACLEPIPAGALELGAGGWTRSTHGVRPIDAVRVVPMMGQSRCWRDSADAVENFGPLRTLCVRALGRPDQGSLGARLHCAMGLVFALLGSPEVVDASAVAPAGGGVRSHAEDSLRDLHGDLSAVLRYPDGRAASVVASDQTPGWDHGALLIGEEGRLRIDDASMTWEHHGAEDADEHSVDWPASYRGLDAFGRALADSLSRLLDPKAPAGAPVVHERVLAMSQAALLSARTGQGESPEVIRKLAVGG